MKPAEQLLQKMLPAFANLPAVQEEQVVSPSWAKVPASQSLHPLLSDVGTEPAWHCEHSKAPLVAKLLLLQFMQSL